MASRGRGAREKGQKFEQLIGRDLRQIFDGKKWVEHHASLTKKQQVAHLKTSRVRRGEQGKGAREGDLVVDERQWWFELQHADKFQPEKKLLQGERDIKQRGEPDRWYAISVCRQTGYRTIWCTMRLRTLLLLSTGKYPADVDEDTNSAIVRVHYTDVLKMLEADERRSL
jgi:hypothetical protein